MNTLENAIKDFFNYLIPFSTEWIEKSKESASFFRGLKNQAEQLQLIERCNWNPLLLEKFPDVQTRLMSKIISGLEEEALQINYILKNLLMLKTKLSSKLDVIERSAHKLDISCDSSFSAIAPPIYKFTEYAEDIMRHYNAMYIKISHALACLDYKNSKTIYLAEAAFIESSVIDDNIKGHIIQWKVLQTG